MTSPRLRRAPNALLLAALAAALACGDEGAGGDGHAGAFVHGAPAEGALTVCAGGPTLKGVDVYHGDGTVSWGQVAAAGRAFAIVKATEGLTFTDPAFKTNWAGMKAAGLVRGAYHFFHANDSGSAQADFFLSVAGSFGPGDLPPVLDWESTDSQPASVSIREAQAFVDRVRARTGLTTILYSSASFFSGLGNPTQFAGYPLWVAHWGVSCPNLPPSFTRWAFWQDSDKGVVPGIGVNVDTDQFNGTLADLQALAGGSPGGAADAGPGDAGSADAGASDGGAADAGAGDGGARDAGAGDAGAGDGGAGDAGAGDAGAGDAGHADAGPGDAGTADPGQGDGGVIGMPPSGGCAAGAIGGGPLPALLLLCGLWRSRARSRLPR